jgi:hypothetical protein
LELITMNLKHSPVAPSPSSTLIDAVLDGYVAWREESATVETTYRHWQGASRDERALAFAAYSAALDREEQAAEEYRRLIARAEGNISVRRAAPARR